MSRCVMHYVKVPRVFRELDQNDKLKPTFETNALPNEEVQYRQTQTGRHMEVKCEDT